MPKPRPPGRKREERPACIVHWSEIQKPDAPAYPGLAERFSIGSPFGAALGLSRIGIWHDVLPPGRRSSLPHAERDEEEFVFVIEGTPDVWLNGHLHRLKPGDGVGFPNGTGLAHAFINNTEEPVRLMVVGEASRRASGVHYPLNPKRNTELGERHWPEAAGRRLGDHDGLPDAARPKRGRAKS